MITRPLELVTHINVHDAVQDTETLVQNGFSSDEIVSVLWLRQWYQNGGSDRIAIVRRLEFLKLLIAKGKIEI